MAQFNRRVLSLLDTIYSFISEKVAVSDVELSHPIQLVHNVSREAELGEDPPQFGVWNLSMEVSPTSNDVSSDWNPYYGSGPGQYDGGVRANGFTVDPSKQWLWILEASIWAANSAGVSGVLSYMGMYVHSYLYAPAFGGRDQVASVSGNRSWLIEPSLWKMAPMSGVGYSEYVVGGYANYAAKANLQRPVLVPPSLLDSSYTSKVTLIAGATAGTVHVSGYLTVWVGPIGVFPPGMG